MSITPEAIVVGASKGGFDALKTVLAPLPENICAPILVVRHQAGNITDYAIKSLNQVCQLKVKYAEENEKPVAGTVYLAPPDKHLLVSENGRLTLSQSEKVNFSRPAIDPLFQSAASFYGRGLLAVLLTGLNSDGTKGVIRVKSLDGKVLVQDPDSAEAREMPQAALAAADVDYIVWLEQIGPFIWQLCRDGF
jgi:two-component system chemotaxis response regulator CheB